MNICPSHDALTEMLKEIKEDAKGMRKDLKDLRDHFDIRHDKNIEVINENKNAIAVLKIKQYAIAAIAGMGGGKVQEILSKLIF